MRRTSSARGQDLTLDAVPDDIQHPFSVSSPRSVDALARHGMLLEELQYRPLDFYREKGTTEEIARMRYEHSEHQRRERIRQVKHEYKTICSTPGNSRSLGSPSGANLSENSMDAQAKEIQAMKKQLEAMKNKQKEEVVEQLMSDFRNEKLAQIRDEKEALARARDAEQLREKERRAKEWEALKVEREARKKEEERLEEIERKKLAEAHFEQEKKAQLRAAYEEKKRKKEAEQREQERVQRTEDLKRQTEAIFAEQQRQADERKRQMDEKDALRRAAMERQRKETLLEGQRKREETEMRMASIVAAQSQAMKEQEIAMQEKHRKQEAKRIAFEAKRESELDQARKSAEAKAAHIKATIEQNDRREEEKKNVYRAKEAEAQERLRILAIEKEKEDQHKQAERDERERARLAAIDKAYADEEARKIQLLAKFEADSHKLDRVTAERNREMAIKNERERLNKQDKIAAVERLKRVEAYNREKQTNKIQEDNRRLAEMNHKKYLLQQEKIKARKEQESKMKGIQAAVEKFNQTKIWQPPPGLDFDLDVHEIKKRAEAQVMRSREPSENSLSRISASGSPSLKSGPKPTSTAISKKRAPLSARGRIQAAAPDDSHRQAGKGPAVPHAQEFAESVPREELGGGDGGRSRAKEGGGGAGERPASAEGSSSLAYEEDFIPEDEGSGTSGLAERYGYDARAQAARHVDEGQDDGLAHVYRYREEEASAAGQEVPDWGRDDGYGGDGRRRGDRKDVLRPNTTGHSLTLKAPPRRSRSGRGKGVPGWRHPVEADPLGPARRPSTGAMQGSSKLADAAYRPAKKTKRKASTGQGSADNQLASHSRQAAMQVLDGLRRQQNEQLLAILEEEQAKEAEREVRMADVFQQKDKAHLERVFSRERSEASLRIIDITARHEHMLSQTMIQLGLT